MHSKFAILSTTLLVFGTVSPSQAAHFNERTQSALEGLLAPKIDPRLPGYINSLSKAEKVALNGEIQTLSVASVGIMRGALSVGLKQAGVNPKGDNKMTRVDDEAFQISENDFDLSNLIGN